MPHQNEPTIPTGGPRGGTGVATELRRARWLSAGALLTIALTVLGLALFTDRQAEGAGRVHWIATVVVCLEVLVVLVATARMSRQIVEHAQALDDQQEQLESQATRLEEQTAEVATTNARLVESVAELEQARGRAEGEARQKARVVAVLDAALGSSPVGFAFFDPQLRFLRVNAALATINALAPEDHVGLSLGDIHPWLAKEVEPVLRAVLESRRPVVNIEFVGPVPSSRGERRNWLASCFPIITDDGELFGVGVAVSDVTEIKRLEERFLQAQKMEAVGRLAGGVAHDFNNLLTVISGFAELILYDPEMEKGREEIEEIRAAAARAAKLTRQLLAFSRRQAMEPRIVNPNDVLRGVEVLLRELVIGRVEILTRLSPETPLIRVDPGQLEQVVMNLAINAGDAMPEGGRLGIETAYAALDETFSRRVADVRPGIYAMIRVTDTGTGMPPDVVAQIFEPFFTTKAPGRGTGLGLSTAFGIIKQSGGHIDVESMEGEGTVFTVYLPAVDSDDDAV